MIESFWTPKKVDKKDMSFIQAQSVSKISEFGDEDGDGVKNWIDSNPLNKDKKLGIGGY